MTIITLITFRLISITIITVKLSTLDIFPTLQYINGKTENNDTLVVEDDIRNSKL